MRAAAGRPRPEIVAGALEAAAAEMCAGMIKSARSPNLEERADCSTALADAQGRILSIATHAPAHLGSVVKIVPAILGRFPLDRMAPGDVFLGDDPYSLGLTHRNDCAAVAPVFVAGRPVAFAIAVAHHSDVGGGESGDSAGIFEEGVRFPPIRLVKRGVRRADLWELVRLNSRTPDFGDGDLLAPLAALERGRIRVEELYGRHGIAATRAAIEQVLDATERRLRGRIQDVLRSGIYRAADRLDDDGISATPVRLATEMSIDGDAILFDFSGCPAQLGSGKNLPLAHTLATVVFCLKAVVDPSLPTNDGVFRAVHIRAPEGSILNPNPPGAAGSRNLTAVVLADILFGVLGQAAPGRAIAASGAFQETVLSGWDARRRRYFVDYETLAGGAGALPTRDGDDAMHMSMTNTSNLPIETLETEFPLRVERYELAADSGGAGRYRGGLGIRRDIRILADGVALATRSARERFAAPGLDGGRAGGVGAFHLDRAAIGEVGLPGTGSEIPLRPGDLLRIRTAGGGGYGEPGMREEIHRTADRRSGKISRKAARKAYR